MIVITRKDYQAAIETCQYSMGSLGLKNFIDDFIREHNSSNTDILSTLMEYVLEIYPEVEDSDNWENFHEKDYSNFNEEVRWYDQPQLQYLYSYLVYLSEKEFGYLNENGEVDYTPSKIKKVAITNGDVSLKSDLSKEKLSAICDWLIEHRLIEKIKKDDFTKIFSSIPLAKINAHIKWQAKYGNGNDNVLLFYLLDRLSTSNVDPSYTHTCVLIKNLFTLRNTQKSLSKSFNTFKDLTIDKRKRLRDLENFLDTIILH